MARFSPTVSYRGITTRDRRISPDIPFAVWASLLIGVAIVVATLGVAPVADPTVLPGYYGLGVPP
jgi:hypothetical protein